MKITEIFGLGRDVKADGGWGWGHRGGGWGRRGGGWGKH